MTALARIRATERAYGRIEAWAWWNEAEGVIVASIRARRADALAEAFWYERDCTLVPITAQVERAVNWTPRFIAERAYEAAARRAAETQVVIDRDEARRLAHSHRSVIYVR